jgi:hypothetical protein
VDAMLCEMTSAEFAEWFAFYRLEPWGCEAEEHRAGILAATVANTVPRKPGTPGLRPSDFFPPRVKPKADPLEQIKAAFGYAPPDKG